MGVELMAKSKKRGAGFVEDMLEDPNMGANPRWIAKNLDKVPPEVRKQYEIYKGRMKRTK